MIFSKRILNCAYYNKGDRMGMAVLAAILFAFKGNIIC